MQAAVGTGYEIATVSIVADGIPSQSVMEEARRTARRISFRPLRDASGLSRGLALVDGAMLRLVEDRRGASALADSLEARGSNPEWHARMWAQSAVDRSKGILMSVSERDGTAAGFISYRRVPSVEVHDGGVLSFNYSVRPDYVYLAPDARGQGLSRALRRSVLNVVEADFRRLSRLREDGALDDLPVGFEVMGMASSPEGAGFMEALRQDIARRVEECFLRGELEAMGYEGVAPAF